MAHRRYRRDTGGFFINNSNNTIMTESKFNESLAREITAKKMYGRIKTRDGYTVRIVCWDAKGWRPIVGLIDLGDIEMPMKFTRDGKCDTRPYVATNNDLVIETEGGEA